MDVCHQWLVIALQTETLLNIFQVFSLYCTLGSQSDIIATRIDDPLALFDTTFRICCSTSRHTLDTQRLVATQGAVSYLYLMRGTRRIIE
ncbi:hypothetical protein EVA_17391 [gut metagenome]|uniref:Uncharacterized protein n=1 Tax=gut metagenome TaxID=749906 RepID=J9FJB1_9ZZZZ